MSFKSTGRRVLPPNSWFHQTVGAFVGPVQGMASTTVYRSMPLSGGALVVERLPNHVSPSAKSPQGRSIRDQKPKPEAQKWPVWIALSVAVLVAVSRLFGN